MMMRFLVPDMLVEKVLDIDLGDLKAGGFDTLIMDLDNTLVGWRARSVPDEIISWIRNAEGMGFRLCIVSNCALSGRVAKFSRLMGIPALSKAIKPRRKTLRRAVKMLGSLVENTVVIGDQIFTDILGGNRLGAYTILVRPVDRREFCTTLIQRLAEKFVLFNCRRKGLLNVRAVKKEIVEDG
jgi:HAD superfamily phosphatase (TIGR01668 family)